MVKNIVASLLAASPLNKFSNQIYHLIFELNRPLFSLLGGEVWPRNSVAFDYSRLGLSDFDLSLMLKERPDRERLNDIDQILSILNFTMGRMGEVVIYRKDNLDFFRVFGNPFELARDPYFKIDLNKATKYQKACFLMRMFESDKYNLEHHPELRREKWGFLFSLIGKELSQGNLYEQIERVVHQDFKNESLLSSHELWYPHTNLEQYDHQILCEQVKWEIWGLYTQQLFLNRVGTYSIHIENIHGVCQRYLADHKDFELLKEGLRKLLS